MAESIRILYIDDNPMDRALVRDSLEKVHGGFILTEAKSKSEFEKLIRKEAFDLVLTDFNILGFEGLQVLATVQSISSDIPVIIVTGTGSEEVAVEAMKSGAADYVIKTTSHLSRLPVTILSVLETKHRDKKIKESEDALISERKVLRTLIDNLPDMIYVKDIDCRKVIANISDVRNIGFVKEAEVIGKTDLELFPGEVGRRGYDDDKEIIETGKPIFDREEYFIRENGEKKWFLTTKVPLFDKKGKVTGLVGMGHDITKRKQTENELILAKEKAEESDRLKSAFLANMSHEIRTPMNGILGFTNLLQKPNLTGENQQKYIQIIQKSGARMLNILNDIVSISKIESGLVEVNIAESNINEQIEYIYSFFKPEVEAKGMQLFYKNSLPFNEAIIQTDHEKLVAILTNLVKNAIKYSEEGSIEIGYDKKGEFFEFYVKDTGIGIDRERQIAIFDRFIQADIADVQARQGAGLGLAISKEYVEMLGGKIWLDSEKGRGTTFYFTISHLTENSL